MRHLTIGCDPEFFLEDKKTGKVVSAHPHIPGTKERPHVLCGGGTVQLDGIACEIGINPAATSSGFRYGLEDALFGVKKILKNKNLDFNFNFSPAVFFDKEYYEKEIPPRCKTLGCDPDRDAYRDGAINTFPVVDMNDPRGIMRTGAGHLHFGWTEKKTTEDVEHLKDCLQLTRNLDLAFGYFERKWDFDTDRRKMYGKPGCFRVKPYGMEYRSLSNAWLGQPDLWEDIYRTAVWTFRMTERDINIQPIFKNKDKQILEVLRTMQNAGYSQKTPVLAPGFMALTR